LLWTFTVDIVVEDESVVVFDCVELFDDAVVSLVFGFVDIDTDGAVVAVAGCLVASAVVSWTAVVVVFAVVVVEAVIVDGGAVVVNSFYIKIIK